MQLREGSIFTFGVNLSFSPGKSALQVSLRLPAALDGSVSVQPSVITFDSSNWGLPVQVSLHSVRDFAVGEGSLSSTLTLSAMRVGESSAIGSVSRKFSVVEADSAAIMAVLPLGSLAPFPLQEGASTTLTVSLGSRPLQPVTLSIVPNNSAISVKPSTVVVDSSSWANGVVVTVSAGDDTFVMGNIAGTIAVSVAVGDGVGYIAGSAITVPITVLDNDVAGFLFSPDQLVIRNGSATLQVSLTAQPGVSVLVTLATSSGAPFTLSPRTFTVADASWAVPVSVGTASNTARCLCARCSCRLSCDLCALLVVLYRCR
jgi:hypothetical protein